MAPASALRLSALDLEVLDAAALDWCPFYAFCDDPACGSPAQLLSLGARKLAHAVVRLQDLGLLQVQRTGGGGPVTTSVRRLIPSIREPHMAIPVADERRSVLRSAEFYGYALTDSGGAAWTEFRRPLWERFVEWISSATSIACTGREERAVEQHVLQYVATSPDPGSVALRRESVDAWRETYWRPAGRAHTVHIDASQVSRSAVAARVLEASGNQLLQVRGLGALQRHRRAWTRWPQAAARRV